MYVHLLNLKILHSLYYTKTNQKFLYDSGQIDRVFGNKLPTIRKRHENKELFS